MVRTFSRAHPAGQPGPRPLPEATACGRHPSFASPPLSSKLAPFPTTVWQPTSPGVHCTWEKILKQREKIKVAYKILPLCYFFNSVDYKGPKWGVHIHTTYNVNDLENDAQWDKSDIKVHMACDSIYVKQAHPQTHKGVSGCRKLGRGWEWLLIGTESPFWGDGSFWN